MVSTTPVRSAQSCCTGCRFAVHVNQRDGAIYEGQSSLPLVEEDDAACSKPAEKTGQARAGGKPPGARPSSLQASPEAQVKLVRDCRPGTAPCREAARRTAASSSAAVRLPSPSSSFRLPLRPG